MRSVSARAREIVDAARRARPELTFEVDELAAFLDERPERLAASVDAAGELALVFACARGDEAALRAFNSEYLARIPALLPARHRAEAAEVVQALRDRWLVADASGRTKITEFTGKGPLANWLRVAGARVTTLFALNRRSCASRSYPFCALARSSVPRVSSRPPSASTSRASTRRFPSSPVRRTGPAAVP
jgi:hypothetical protein